MDPEISIIVPCLNEEQNIPTLVAKLEEIIHHYELSAEILIVDDCSDDYTFKEALILESTHAAVRALHKGLPRGIGTAIREGIRSAKGKMGVIVMGDLVDPLTAIPDFRTKIIDEGYDLALLSRYLAPEDSRNIPLSYRFYQFWYRKLCQYLVGVRVKDITYAFRAFSLPWVKALSLVSNEFEISPEVTLKTWLRGGKICEIKGRQARRMSGESKFFFSRAGLGFTRVLLAAFKERLTGGKRRYEKK